jgi:hypothetical protein
MAKGILDSSGQPIHSDDGEAGRNLSPAIEAFVEVKVNSGLDNLREHNRVDLKCLAQEYASKWRYVALISSAAAFISWAAGLVMMFYAPSQIIGWIGTQVDNKLTQPMIQETADRLIKEKMGDFVSDKLKPLDQEAEKLKATIDDMNVAIADKQAAIEDQQKKLASQLHIQELAVAAKAGSRQAYTELLSLRALEVDASGLLAASLREIELFYDADRNQLARLTLVKNETLKDPGYAADEAIFVLRHQEPKLMEAAINTLCKLKSKASVKELCKIVSTTDDLRAATCATRAIEEITGERIRPLEFEKVEAWWRDNQKNTSYCGDYDGYCEVMKQIEQGHIQNSAIPDLIARLSRTIATEPEALHSMCLKAGLLTVQGDLDAARGLLADARKIRGDYYWLPVWEGSLKVKEGDLRGAVESVNRAFEKSPSSDVEFAVRAWAMFTPIKDDPNLNWPSKLRAK